MPQERTSRVLVKPIGAHFGAEIHGVDLAEHLEDAEVAEIRRALLRWKVLFFRDQNLGHGEQIVFARRFGEVTCPHPLEGEPVDQLRQVLPIGWSNDPSRWQGGINAAVDPPAASLLRAVNVPRRGSASSWADLVAAYRALPAQLRTLADGLKAEHRFEPHEQRVAASGALASIHPVVRVHPETRERALFVSPAFTTRLLDVSSGESERLLGLFFEQLARPESTLRFAWNRGDLAFWDNRAASHLGPQDAEDLGEHLFYRVALSGEIPVGTQGFRSQLLEGEPAGLRA
jgi:alpha-ketoglutarate-dependent taurine dioxygenase